MTLPEIYKLHGRTRFWTHSKSPARGCTKISEGCLHCFAETMGCRFHSDKIWGHKFDGTIYEYLHVIDEIPAKRKHRKPRVWSYWNDIFHDGVSQELRDKLFDTIEKVGYDYHTIVTKRPEAALHISENRTPIKNLIIFITTENQVRLDERIEFLKTIHELGWYTGLLAMPLLEEINIRNIGFKPTWVICGPERGGAKRKFDDSWGIGLAKQCERIDIPFLFSLRPLANGVHYKGVPNI